MVVARNTDFKNTNKQTKSRTRGGSEGLEEKHVIRTGKREFLLHGEGRVRDISSRGSLKCAALT